MVSKKPHEVLLIATRNRGKVGEIERLLTQRGLVLRGLDEFLEVPEVEETANTFAGNAQLKAHAYAQATGLWALADDSGLEVAALNGAPGVYAARYGGPGLDDAGRVQYLLQQLAGVPAEKWQARFVCTMALANPAGDIVFTGTGTCEGHLINTPRGTNGFGYDPIFVPQGHTQTFAELPAAVKNDISHRARATHEVKKFLAMP